MSRTRPSELEEFYHKYAPRWFRAIQWERRVLFKFAHQQRFLMATFYPLILFGYYGIPSLSQAMRIFLFKPQTEEELISIKRNALCGTSVYQRDWEMGQYSGNSAPHYDLWERRSKYPEHYGERYSGFKRDGDAVYK